MKVLSVIIPSYNCEKTLHKCIDSFLPTLCFEKIEIIVVNDGSSDSTEKIALSYCDNYPDNIRLISQENKGHGGALNTGCTAATGKYLKVVDADDWVVTENLETFINFLEANDSDVVLTHHYTTDISSGEIKQWKSYPKQFGVALNFEEIMSDWNSFERSLTFHGITYNTEFYKENRIPLCEHVFYEDHEFATIPCCFAKSITPLDLFIYNYRIGDVTQSVSNENQLKRISHIEAIIQKLLNEFSNINNLSDAAKRYYCMKTQGVLLSFLTTALLVEPNRAKGRKLSNNVMKKIRTKLPLTYSLAKKQYTAFKLMNYLHISKNLFERILRSKLYTKIRSKHDFN